MAELEAAWRAHLIADATVFGLVGSRIYPGLAPEAASLPLITYQRISGVRRAYQQGGDGYADVRFQVNCYASTYGGAKTLATAVRNRLDGIRTQDIGTGSAKTNVRSVTLVDDGDEVLDRTGDGAQLDYYGIQQDYEIWHAESY